MNYLRKSNIPMALLSVSLFLLPITGCDRKGASPVEAFKSVNKTVSDTDSLHLVRPFIRTQALDKSSSSNHKGKVLVVVHRDKIEAEDSSIKHCTDSMKTSASTHLKIRTSDWSVEVTN